VISLTAQKKPLDIIAEDVSRSGWLPLLDRFSNWLMSGEVKIFREFYNTEFGNDPKSLSIG